MGVGGGGGGGGRVLLNKTIMPIKNKTLHMNSELQKITTKWRSQKWATSNILMKR